MNDDAIGTAIIFLMICTGLVVSTCMSQTSNITKEEWETANKECSHGVKKVYLDGDYECEKKGE